MKNMASNEGDEVFEKFSEQARQTFLIFPTVSVSETKKKKKEIDKISMARNTIQFRHN